MKTLTALVGLVALFLVCEQNVVGPQPASAEETRPQGEEPSAESSTDRSQPPDNKVKAPLPEQVEIVAETAKVKASDEVLTSVDKGDRFTVVRRDGAWVAVKIEIADEERYGWLLATQVRTVVAEGITEDTPAPEELKMLEANVELTQVLSDNSMGSRNRFLYLRLTITNGDMKPVRYDASDILLQVDGQDIRHTPTTARSYGSTAYVQLGSSAKNRKKTSELDYLGEGEISPGGKITGWLRFRIPSFRKAGELAEKTWVLATKIAERSVSGDLLDVENRALDAKIRPSGVEESVRVVEIGSRLNALNIAQLRKLIEPLISKKEMFVIAPKTDDSIVDAFARADLQSSSPSNPLGQLMVWVDKSQSSRTMTGPYYIARCPSEAVAVMQILGRRRGYR